MPVFLKILLILIAALTVSVVLVLLRLFTSPMPVVRLLRRDMGDALTYPAEYKSSADRVNVLKDINYPSGFGKNTLDLYLPKSPGSHPLVLWVHGGAFVAGDKSGVENWGVMLAANGYTVAAMNYEWAPEATYPAQVQQIADALSFLCRTAVQYDFSVQRIAIAGDSAGAHLASQFVLVHTNTRFAQAIGVTSPLKKEELACALLYCGPYDLQQMLCYPQRMIRFFISRIGWSVLGRRNWQKSPLAAFVSTPAHITSDFVPCYLTDGNKGSFESHARALAKALRACGVETQERYFDLSQGEVGHEYQMQLESNQAQLCFLDTLLFLKEHLRDEV